MSVTSGVKFVFYQLISKNQQDMSIVQFQNNLLKLDYPSCKPVSESTPECNYRENWRDLAVYLKLVPHCSQWGWDQMSTQ